MNQQKNGQNKPQFYSSLEAVISDFSPRSKEVVKMRYGIDHEEPRTLEEIGKKYEVTRERVRQIISEVFKKLKAKKNHPMILDVKEKIHFTLKEKSGIIKEEEIIMLLGKEDAKERRSVKFFMDLLDDVIYHELPGEMEKSVGHPEFDVENWKRINEQVKKTLDKIQRPVEIESLIKEVVAAESNAEDAKRVVDFLSVSSRIRKNNFGKWGLSDWKEISPKGTREKAYLVLKEASKPLHFKEIADLIDKHKLNKKKTHPQTVHNELIKDERFVLVGRGVYALADWGYQKGTVREVLEGILKDSGQPLSKDEILSKVMEVRKVKKSTVVINLNNFFLKIGKDKYSLKK